MGELERKLGRILIGRHGRGTTTKAQRTQRIVRTKRLENNTSNTLIR
jgi:hypothetical protein